MENLELAINSLKDTLLDSWAAVVDAVNVNRVAFMKCRKVGPYTIPAGASLPLVVDGVPYDIPLPMGVQDAAVLAQEVDRATGDATACTSDQGRLALRTANPVSQGQDRALELTNTPAGLQDVLGLPDYHVVVESPLNYILDDRFYTHRPEVRKPPPFIMVERMRDDRDDRRGREGLSWVRLGITIGDYHQGGSAQATQSMMFAYAAVVKGIIMADRSLGGNAVATRLEAIQADPRLYRMDESGPVFGEIEVDLAVRIHQR